MATRMQQRRGTAEQWTTANPVLDSGEIGFESDTNRFKMGDGVNNWATLSYFENSLTLGGSFDDYIPLDTKGEPLGVAELDIDGQVPASQLGNATVDLSDYATETYADTAAINAVAAVIDAAPTALNTLNELAAALGDDANYAATITAALGDKAPLASPTFTGTVAGVTKTHVGLANVDNTSDANKPISTATQAALDAKASTSYVDTEIAAIPAPDYTGLATETFANSAVSTHSSDTTDVHGIADTSLLATKSYADAAASNAAAAIVDSAPGALDTLNELAAAINDDASFAATITTALGNKQDKVTNVSDTEIGYLDGVTSSIQTQINGKLSATITSPASSQVISYDGTSWVNSAAPSSGSGTTVSETAPSSPEEGEFWFNSTNGTTYIYYDSFWVELSPGIIGPTGLTGPEGPEGPEGPAGPASMTLIYSGTLSSTDVSITSIPQNYKHLQLYLKNLKWDNLPAIRQAFLGLNGLVGGYYTTRIGPSGSTSQSDYINIPGTISGNNFTRNSILIDFPFYSSNGTDSYAMVLSKNTGYDGVIVHTAGFKDYLNNISSIQLVLNSVNLLQTGSYELYGVN